MNLAIEGDLAKHLFVLLKKDRSLAHALALQWLDKIDTTAMYQYLLDQDKVLDLLAALLQKAPEETMEDLKALAKGKKPAARAAKKKVGRPKKKPGRPKKKPGRPKKENKGQ